METLKIKIVVLWVAVICGFALHTLADLLPLFWGENITIEATGNACWTACLHDGRQLPDTCNWYSLCFIWLP